jgi:hypothetical protein
MVTLLFARNKNPDLKTGSIPALGYSFNHSTHSLSSSRASKPSGIGGYVTLLLLRSTSLSDQFTFVDLHCTALV